jgi:hypothetical protein
MRNIHCTAHSAPLSSQSNPPLTASERRNVALASLTVMERGHRLRIVQIQAERRALLASQYQ